MVFNDDDNNDDICSDIDYWAGTDDTSYTLERKSANSNRALDDMVQVVEMCDGLWKWDDNNQTDLPIATTALVAGQSDTTLSVSHLKISRVRIKDQNGNWITLDPVSAEELPDNATASTPSAYAKVASSIIFNCPPSYGYAGGLEVRFERGASYFAPDDTDKEPGFAAPFHRIISLSAALDYTDTNDLDDRSAKIRRKLGEPPTEETSATGMWARFVSFYSSRFTDQKVTLQPESDDYGASMINHGSSQGSENTFSV